MDAEFLRRLYNLSFILFPFLLVRLRFGAAPEVVEGGLEGGVLRFGEGRVATEEGFGLLAG